MPETARPQKITFGEMRESGINRLLIYCADYKCSHSIQMSADRWPDHVRIQPAHIVAWSLWRRAHQAAAQRAHFKAKRQL